MASSSDASTGDDDVLDDSEGATSEEAVDTVAVEEPLDEPSGDAAADAVAARADTDAGAVPTTAPSTPPPSPPTPLQAYRAALSALQKACDAESFARAAKLLATYCKNAANDPHEPRFRRIRRSNAAFERHLAPHAAAADCLLAIGFVEGVNANQQPIYVMGTADTELLRSAEDATRRRAQLMEAWPEALRGAPRPSSTAPRLLPSSSRLISSHRRPSSATLTQSSPRATIRHPLPRCPLAALARPPCV